MTNLEKKIREFAQDYFNDEILKSENIPQDNTYYNGLDIVDIVGFAQSLNHEGIIDFWLREMNSEEDYWVEGRTTVDIDGKPKIILFDTDAINVKYGYTFDELVDEFLDLQAKAMSYTKLKSNKGRKRTITITVKGGCVVDVKNLPAEWQYKIKDLD